MNLELIDDSGVIPSGTNSGYSHTRIVRVSDGNANGNVFGRKLRTTVRHDGSYDFQSSYTVEVWNAGLGWQEVCRWVGGDAHVKTFALPKVFLADRDLPKAETAVAKLVEWMQDTAIKVLS